MEQQNPLDQYATLSVIGKGSYAKVVLVRKKANSKLYAMKSMKKKYIQKKNQVKRIMMERQILISVDHPFLIKIDSAFQDEKKIFLVLEYCPGGQLFGLLYKKKRLNELQARFYASQIILALQYLHSKNIIYRDLKPENVLIGADGYIKLTDFGLSKNNITGDYDSFSVCGTPEYLAPQVIKKQGHGKAVDWWCLGSIIYELVFGLPPFYTKNRSQLFEKIKNSQPYMNKMWSNDLKHLFSKLFAKNPQQRQQFIPQIKSHPWFNGLDWQKILQKTIKPPFIPVINSQSDVSNFDKQFTTCSIQSYVSSYGDTKQFEGFSYEMKNSPSNNQMQMQLQQQKIQGQKMLMKSQEIQMQIQQL